MRRHLLPGGGLNLHISCAPKRTNGKFLIEGRLTMIPTKTLAEYLRDYDNAELRAGEHHDALNEAEAAVEEAEAALNAASEAHGDAVEKMGEVIKAGEVVAYQQTAALNGIISEVRRLLAERGEDGGG